MSQETLLLYIMTVFVTVSAIALCIQAGLLYGIYKAARSVSEHTASVVPQAKNILAMAESTLDQSRKHVVEMVAKANEITGKANEIMDSAKLQMAKLDEVVTDAATRTRRQLERAEMVVGDTVSRVHESVAAVHNGIMKPIREINGLAVGVKTAMIHLIRRSRPNITEVTQQEEMFI